MSKVLPTKSLFDPNKAQQHQYVPSNSTDVAATWARFRAEHAKPMDGDQYQRDAIAEHDSLIPLLTASIEDARAKRAAKKR